MIFKKNILKLFLIHLTVFGQELFDPYTVHSLDILFHRSDYDSVLQARWEVDDKTYESADIVFNGDTLKNVGVRYKGNSTFWWARQTENPKFPLNIDFNEFDDSQDLWGYNKVKLSNALFDPTYVKETLGYLTESFYLPSPKTGYINVTLNGELLGLYLSVESVVKPFLAKHFKNKSGTFFKCEPQFHYGDPYDAYPDLRWYGSDSTAYEYQMGYELKSESGWQDLLNLIYTLNFDLDHIETILNVDRVLWFFAASTVMPDLDTYNGLYMHNFYLYKNTKSGQFEIIPWDKDHTFGGALVIALMGMGGDSSWVYQWDPFLFENDDERPLFSQLMKNPRYKQIYTAHIRTIINEIYSTEYFQPLAYEIQNTIETFAANDPNLFAPFSGGEYFRYNVDHYLITPGEVHLCGILPTIRKRLEYLLSHKEIHKTGPEILDVTREIHYPKAGEGVVIRTKVTGATQVELMVTAKPYPGHFLSVPMYDDGHHEDGGADDLIYGAIIPFQSAGDRIKYYIRAKNDEALVLNPEKAEREFYYYNIGGDDLPDSTLVINEINYNSPDTFDPGDWVELYNPTSQPISLDKWTIKDENDDHTFYFPDHTILTPNHFLVICEDSLRFKSAFPYVQNFVGDLGFGFDGSGELIRLMNENEILIDTVNYDDVDPWPESPDGKGPTLELINPWLDNAMAENWSASIGLKYGSPGRKNSTALSTKPNPELPQKFMLLNNYPNPFNPYTTIEFSTEIGLSLPAQLTIYDIRGRLIKTLVDGVPVSNTVVWDGKNNEGETVSAGVYLYKLDTPSFSKTKKMVFLK